MIKKIFKILEVGLLFARILPMWFIYEENIKRPLYAVSEQERYSAGNSLPYDYYIFFGLLPYKLLIIFVIIAESYLIYLIKKKNNK